MKVSGVGEGDIGREGARGVCGDGRTGGRGSLDVEYAERVGQGLAAAFEEEVDGAGPGVVEGVVVVAAEEDGELEAVDGVGSHIRFVLIGHRRGSVEAAVGDDAAGERDHDQGEQRDGERPLHGHGSVSDERAGKAHRRARSVSDGVLRPQA